MNLLKAVARFNANSDRANLNCNRNPQNSKSKKDENPELGITQVIGHHKMKTYNNLYGELYSFKNLELAFKKAKKRKSKRPYVKEFEANLLNELNKLKQELEYQTYKPQQLKRFIVRDPKTRTIHASSFRDRVVYHALVNIISPIFEKRFIHDSYASRINKGTHNAILRFDKFKRKVSNNGRLVKNAKDNNSVKGYILKADIRHYFETVDHEVLLNVLERRIKDERVIWLIKQILNNFDIKIAGKGMPLGNLTSQFFANIYLNELDYFVKQEIRARYYIRYVDDFVIMHQQKDVLESYKQKIDYYLMNSLKLKLHSDKSKIIPLKNGVTFLGYKNFYYYRLLRKNNKRRFERDFNEKLILLKEGVLVKDNILEGLQGWFGYAIWANTYRLRKEVIARIVNLHRPLKTT
ncbi:MAG: reverse transcriptase domain-containing protein [Candidatus Nanoarchaeia archaeon]|nr:reverse transcriptase domain-containing protein [Candidatus Nanoarchaeia archaeon]